MTRSEQWSADGQRYLDGERPLPDDAAEADELVRFEAAVRSYAAGLSGPDERIDARVMASVRERPVPRSARRWRRYVEPRAVMMRPALVAAAAVGLVVVSSLTTALLDRRGEAGAPGPQAATVTAGRTVLVRFELRAPDARRVTLAGSFNDWNDSATVFVRGTDSDVWSVTVALEPGRYQYLFVVDGVRWIPDPTAHAQVEDEFGEVNSLLVVGPRGVVRS